MERFQVVLLTEPALERRVNLFKGVMLRDSGAWSRCGFGELVAIPQFRECECRPAEVTVVLEHGIHAELAVTGVLFKLRGTREWVEQIGVADIRARANAVPFAGPA